MEKSAKPSIFATDLRDQVDMVDVAQSVRVTDCGSEGRGFESHLPPQKQTQGENLAFFCCVCSLTASSLKHSQQNPRLQRSAFVFKWKIMVGCENKMI